ncbi:hypothetical protein CC80DRAFT_551819 [Byssothecium circinans]|uniref:Uncharacterized protein n=1 Tax=Byssothecium circinans TaxID=147558 RepID=A0A6A5TVZ7_9PLEO|nr:hypothetical protein CC80DRAFT_551819 [Byssothecium circinans]
MEANLKPRTEADMTTVNNTVDTPATLERGHSPGKEKELQNDGKMGKDKPEHQADGDMDAEQLWKAFKQRAIDSQTTADYRALVDIHGACKTTTEECKTRAENLEAQIEELKALLEKESEKRDRSAGTELEVAGRIATIYRQNPSIPSDIKSSMRQIALHDASKLKGTLSLPNSKAMLPPSKPIAIKSQYSKRDKYHFTPGSIGLVPVAQLQEDSGCKVAMEALGFDFSVKKYFVIIISSRPKTSKAYIINTSCGDGPRRKGDEFLSQCVKIKKEGNGNMTKGERTWMVTAVSPFEPHKEAFVFVGFTVYIDHTMAYVPKGSLTGHSVYDMGILEFEYDTRARFEAFPDCRNYFKDFVNGMSDGLYKKLEQTSRHQPQGKKRPYHAHDSYASHSKKLTAHSAMDIDGHSYNRDKNKRTCLGNSNDQNHAAVDRLRSSGRHENSGFLYRESGKFEGKDDEGSHRADNSHYRFNEHANAGSNMYRSSHELQQRSNMDQDPNGMHQYSDIPRTANRHHTQVSQGRQQYGRGTNNHGADRSDWTTGSRDGYRRRGSGRGRDTTYGSFHSGMTPLTDEFGRDPRPCGGGQDC